MILVDSSVWSHHFRRHNPQLFALLSNNEVYVHPVVLGELLLAGLPKPMRQLMARLPPIREASHVEVRALIEKQKLMGQGIGYMDVSLLTSAVATDVQLWTDDEPLQALAVQLGVAFTP